MIMIKVRKMAKYKELTDKRWLKEMLQSHTQRDIADILGCGVDTVNRWVKKHQLNPPKKSGFTKEQLMSMLRTMSLKEIGERYGISKQAVRARAQKFGIDTSRDITSPLRDANLFKDLHCDQNLSFSEIARRYQTTPEFVSNVAKCLGIKCQTIEKEKEIDIKKASELYKMGLSPMKIARKLGKSDSLIRRKLEKSGIQMRNYYDAIQLNSSLTKEYLEQTILDKKSISDIAKETDISKKSIRNAFIRNGLVAFNKAKFLPKELDNRDKLFDLYWAQKLSVPKIAEKYGCRENSIYRAMTKHNVRIRTISEASARSSKYSELNNPKWLKEQYWDNEMSMEEIAKLIGCSIGNVRHYIVKYDINIRDGFEANILASKKARYRNKELNISGHKLTIETRFGTFRCNSRNELNYLIDIEHDQSIISIIPNYPIEWYDKRGDKHTYNADFMIKRNDEQDTLIEVKDKGLEDKPEYEKSKLIRQIRAGLSHSIPNGQNFILSSGTPCHVVLNTISDDDIYYSYSYFDVFSDYKELSNFILNCGFKGAKLSTSDLLYGYRKLRSVEPSLNANHPCKNGIRFIRHFHQHFYDCYHKQHLSISEAFKQRSILDIIAAKAFNNRSNKRFSIYDFIDMICKLIKDVKPLSIFKPWIASFIYDKYLVDGGLIFDPCCGWGGRFLGTIDRNIDYIGYDVSGKSVDSNTNMYKFCKSWLGNCSFYKRDSSRDWELSNKVDMVFTSPPYDDTEVYENGSCNIDIIAPICNNSYKYLNNNGKLILNVSRRMEENCINLARKCGFEYIETLEMNTNSIGRESTYEPILVFGK